MVYEPTLSGELRHGAPDCKPQKRCYLGHADRPNTVRQAASTALPNSCIYGSCGGIDLIVPSVDDRVAVEIMDELHDALFQLVF